MKNEVCFLVALLTSLAVMQGRAAALYFSPSAEDTNLCWDNAAGWRTSNGVVNRLPTMTDEVTLDSSRIALAGTGVDTPHALRITNGVKAEAYSFKIACVDASSTASYANSGRVIGVQIEEGGFLHTSYGEERLTIGDNAAGYGVLTMTGGMISNDYVCVGQYGIGVLTNAGGWVQGVKQDPAILLGNKAGSRGTLAVTGGVVTHNGTVWQAASIAVGVAGEGTLDLSGGVVSNRILVGTAATGRGHIKMSGGKIVNRVFLGQAAGSVGDFDFTGGTLVGGVWVGNYGLGRMTLDGGTFHVHPSIHALVPSYTGVNTGHGMILGNHAGACGILTVKKPGLTFESSVNTALLCGLEGEGRTETFVDLEMPYLRIGGNTASMSSYAAYAGTTTTVSKVLSVGGYQLLSTADWTTATDYPGYGSLILSNAVLKLTKSDTSDPQLYIGRYAEGFGVLRGCGAVHGTTWNANTVRIVMGSGQVIGDGFGEQRTLDLNAVVSVTNRIANADDGTNGWYAVNKGAVLFPRVWLSAASDTRIIGAWTRNAAPDFVNSVGFSLNNAASPGNGYYVRGGLYAADRSDVHADALPKSGEVVGIWMMGVFSALVDLSAKSFQSIDLTFRYDHTKVERGDLLNLYRWNGSAWTRVTSAKATENPRISCSGLTPIAGESYNIGTFALMCRKTKGFRMIIR